jgi:hypothetical protein
MILAIEEAKAKRKCTMCANSIDKGCQCVHVNVAGFRGASHANICLACFRTTVTLIDDLIGTQKELAV